MQSNRTQGHKEIISRLDYKKIHFRFFKFGSFHFTYSWFSRTCKGNFKPLHSNETQEIKEKRTSHEFILWTIFKAMHYTIYIYIYIYIDNVVGLYKVKAQHFDISSVNLSEIGPFTCNHPLYSPFHVLVYISNIPAWDQKENVHFPKPTRKLDPNFQGTLSLIQKEFLRPFFHITL